MSIFVVYVTYPSKEEAERISTALIENRLAACANIFSEHESIYWWDGKVEGGNEVAVVYKTTNAQFQALKDKIVEMHPFDVPCVVAMPLEDGHAPFLQWIVQETRNA